MLITDLQYDLPRELIAQHPAEPRDSSRLMVVDRRTGRIEHARFHSLPGLLPARTLLVVNDTRVLPARLHLRRESGGKVQALFLRDAAPGQWLLMMTGAARLKVGEELIFDGTSGRRLRLVQRGDGGHWLAEPLPPGETAAILTEHGCAPLPPYILREGGGSAQTRQEDCLKYQTVYARQAGAVAAPTAGLHFTPQLMEQLNDLGMERAEVTLHVGAGTFAPIRVNNLVDHVMHAEWYRCPETTAKAVTAAHAEGRTVLAVGTTSVRVLESCADEHGVLKPQAGWTQLLIYPPYRFKAVGAMVTNFHLPGSTLLAMIFAFAGRELTLRAYAEAVRERYRFYSYGDAMLIL